MSAHRTLPLVLALLATLLLAVPSVQAQPDRGTAQTPEQVAKLTASDAARRDFFGKSVAVDGDTAVIGAVGDDDAGSSSGSAYVFVRSSDGWVEQAKLTASDAAHHDLFGNSVAVDGDTAVISAHSKDGVGSRSGAVYVFVRSGDEWVEQAKLTASDADESDLFGVSVAVTGDTILIGANGDDDAGEHAGAVYVFVRTDDRWVEQAKLTASDAADHDLFGAPAAVDGDTAVFGAHYDDDGGYRSGAVYVFVRSDGGWVEQAKLTASDAASHDYFGSSVAVTGDTILVGADGDDDAGEDSGSMYVFVRTGDGWVEQAKLTASDAAQSDRFGTSVAVDGDNALIGALGYDSTGNASTSVYVFVRSDDGWVEQANLTASDNAPNDLFGTSVALHGGTAVIGAWGDDDAGDGSGSAYVFSLVVNSPPEATDDTYGLLDVGVSVDPAGIAAPAPGVLANDNDPDGHPITAQLVTPPDSGTVQLNDDGSFVYTPHAGFTGIDTFVYAAHDGTATSAPATVTIRVP